MPHRSKFVPALVGALFPGIAPGRLAGWTAGVSLIAILLWLSPMSPTALGHADASLGMGNPERAVARYERVARLNPVAWIRAEALYRAGMVYAVDLDEPAKAREHFEQAVSLFPEHERAAEIHERVGQIRLSEHRPEAAWRAFMAAYEVNPDDPRASERLREAARARGEAGDRAGAEALWDRIAVEFPEHRTRALVAKAALRLASDNPEGALPLYEQVAEQATDPNVIAVARLGAATCLERLGSLEEAMAELDEADLPEGVRESRRKSLNERLQEP